MRRTTCTADESAAAADQLLGKPRQARFLVKKWVSYLDALRSSSLCFSFLGSLSPSTLFVNLISSPLLSSFSFVRVPPHHRYNHIHAKTHGREDTWEQHRWVVGNTFMLFSCTVSQRRRCSAEGTFFYVVLSKPISFLFFFRLQQVSAGRYYPLEVHNGQTGNGSQFLSSSLATSSSACVQALATAPGTGACRRWRRSSRSAQWR